ncbi:MAG TPA: Ivy family c-type lysozyme inhibitor [Polyangia bacterium]|nr:Ivy family c-type lysozyme inhibitor [Polyangia bacterium]
MNRLRASVIALVFVLAASTARAQTIDADSLNLYGGAYAVDCAVAKSPHLLVAADALTVTIGKKTLVGPKPMASYSYFGQSPPPDYQVAFLSDLPSVQQLVVIVSRDAKGALSAKVDAGPKNLAVVSKALAAKPFRRCVPEVKPQPNPLITAETQVTESAWALLDDPSFVPLYRRALGPAEKDAWLVGITGPSSANEKLDLGGTKFVLGKWCKAGACKDNAAVVLWAAGPKLVYGKVVRSGKTTLLGAPPPAIAAELDARWAKAWGSK